MTKTSLLPMIAVVALTTGCQDVALKDNIDTQFDWFRLDGVSDGMHSPYVVGAKLRFYVESADFDETLAGWHVESSNPAVLQITKNQVDERDRLRWAEAETVSPGPVDIIVRGGRGKIEHRVTVEVRVPDRIELWAHGPLLIGHPEEAPVSELRVLEGGTATYLARYYEGAQLLQGTGALEIENTVQGLPAKRVSTFLNEDRDWLQVSTTAVGTATLQLAAGSYPINGANVVVVPAEEIVEVELRGEDESKATDGDWLLVLAEARDAEGRVVYGVEYEWTVDADQESGQGDLYRYKFLGGNEKVLSARFGGQRPSAMIQWGAGYVSSTNHVGCSMSHGGSPTPLVAVFGVAVFALSNRPRRRGKSTDDR